MDADLMKAVVEGMPPKLQEIMLARYAKVVAKREASPPRYASALEELYAKRDELLKCRPELTSDQAFEKVYLDPASRELMLREKSERLAKLGGGSLPQPTGEAATRSTRGVQGSPTYSPDKDARRPRPASGGGPQSGPEPQPTVTSHYEMFQQLAGELRKVRPELTQEMAFAKVFEDPANHELRKSYSAARHAELAGVANL